MKKKYSIDIALLDLSLFIVIKKTFVAICYMHFEQFLNYYL